jgi:predicted Rossmann fold flavoprotein
MAAIAAASAGCRVDVFEQLALAGAKLLASGGGKCNLTNVLPSAGFIEKFGRQGRFMLPALNELSPESLRHFFTQNNVPLIAEDGFHYFPESNRAADVLNALLRQCELLKVNINVSSKITSLKITDGCVTGVITSDGIVASDRVIIACGGRGYPKLGGGTLGYTLAEQAGHEIVEPQPGLAGLRTVETWPVQCAGISFSNVNVFIDLPKHRNRIADGELLFTHHGISGPSVIDFAGEISQLLKKSQEVPLSVNLFAGRTPQYWMEQFDEWQRNSGKKHIRNLLSMHVPAALADIICGMAGSIGDIKAAEFNASGRENICRLLTSMPFRINGTESWDKAMVTRGGVSLKKVNPDTLESRLVRGLFFAGEVLDLDGPCGGYNLQWAFSSGFLAGKSAGKTYN